MVPVGDPQALPLQPPQQESPAGSAVTSQAPDEQSFQDGLRSLHIRLISHGDLRAPIVTPVTSPDKKHTERRLCAKVLVDPGNECATSPVLSIENGSLRGAWDQTLSLQVASFMCISSLNSAIHLVVEIWELGSSSLSPELIGSSRIALQKVVERRNSEPFELVLVRKSGRGYAGKITLSAAFDFDISGISAQPLSSSALAACSGDLPRVGGVKGELIVAVLACGGLEDSSLVPFITAELAGEKSEPQRTEAALWSEQNLAAEGEIPEFPAPVAVWNHHFRFELDLPIRAATNISSLNLKLMGESCFRCQELASAQLDLTDWDALVPVDRSIKCVPMTAAAHGDDVKMSANPLQLLFAFFWSPSSCENGSGIEISEFQPCDKVHEASLALLPSPRNQLSPSTLSSQSLPLGSSLTLAISGICQVPQTVFDKLVAGAKTSEIVARGKLLPSGGTSQAVLPIQRSTQGDPKHCSSYSSSTTLTCFRFLDTDRTPVVLSFELAPSVFDALQLGTEAPRVEIEIRSKRSREWSLSFCVGLALLFAQGGAQAQEMPSQLRLLDERGNCGGMVCTVIGISTSNSSEISSHYPLTMTSTPSTRSPRVSVTLRVQDIKPSSSVSPSSYSQAFIKIWSSSNGRQLAFKSSPMSWDCSGSKKLPGTDQVVMFEVPDGSTEVFFVEFYRFSHHERNEVLGSCSFSLPSELLQKYQTPGASNSNSEQEVRQWMRLSSTLLPSQPRALSGIANANEICGEILIAMQIHEASSGLLASTSVPSLSELKAASILSEVKYTPFGGIQVAENRRVLEVQVMGAYPPAQLESVSIGDSLQVRLQIAASPWSEQSSFQDLVQINAKGDRKVSWSERFTTSNVSWSSKDRLVPALKLELFVRSENSNPGGVNKKPQMALGPTMLSSLGASSLTVKSNSRSKQRNRIPESMEGNGRRLGRCTLDLCAFFTQPTTSSSSSMCLLLLVPVDQFTAENSGDERVERVSSGGIKMIPVLVQMRLTTPLQFSTSTLYSDLVITRPRQINGDVCIHVRAASGGFLRRTDGSKADQYFVSASFGSESVSTRSDTAVASSDTTASGSSNNTVEWDEQIVLPVNCAVTPVIELQIFRKRALSEFRGELVGSLTLPLFPSITHEQHLVMFSLPIAYKMRKEGLLEFEIQFLDYLKNEKLKASLAHHKERVELVVHQLRGLTGGENGLLPSLASSAILQVLKLSPGGTEKQQPNQSLLLYETSISVLRRLGGDGDEVVDIGGDHRVDLTAAISGIQGHEGTVLALQVCDISGNQNSFGHVHFPLRKGWRERHFEQKRQRAWYPLHRSMSQHQQQQQSSDEAKAQIQLSFALVSAASTNNPDREQIAGKLYVQVKESLLSRSYGDQGLVQPRASACVQLWLTKGQGQVLKRGRTRKVLLQERERCWVWPNETFAFDHFSENPYGALQFELVSEALGAVLTGSIEIEQVVQLGLETGEEWVTLTAKPASTATDGTGVVNSVDHEAQLLIQTTFFPALTGVVELALGAIRPLSTSHSFGIPVEKTLFKCVWKQKPFVTAMVGSALINESDAAELSKGQTIEIPFDSRDPENSDSDSGSRGEIPTLLVQWMGFASALQEFCLGECTLNLHAFLPKSTNEPYSHSQQQQFKWYLLRDKHDKSKRTGFVSMRVGFRAKPSIRKGRGAKGAARSLQSTPGQPALSSLTCTQHKVAKSESLVLWKKLFYLLDTNGNGRIDLSEFKQVFLSHKDVLASSLDGQNLIQSLFGDTTTTALVPLSKAQLEELFSEMDANHDQEIEWSEYVNFLLRKLHEHDAQVTVVDDEEGGGGDETNNGSQFAQIPIEDPKKTRELRTKRREDTNATHGSQGTQAPGQTPTATTTQARKSRTDSAIPSPPFSPIASSSSKAKEVSPRKPEVPSLVSSSQPQRQPYDSVPSRRSNEHQTSRGSATRDLVPSSNQLPSEKLDLLRAQLDAKDQESAHLKHELSAAQTIHTLDQQKYVKLSAEYQQLQRSFQILQLAKQREAIQAEAKAVRVQQTIAKHDQLLLNREKQRKHHHEASIILQSKIRSRFEQKRFQARKLQRANAVVTLQCFFRVRKARKTLKALQIADRMERTRTSAASRLQRSVRFHLKRKNRAMICLARQLSAQIIQKHARRFVSVRTWDCQKRAILALQRWTRQRLASRLCGRFRKAKCVIKRAILVWIYKWRYIKARKMVQRLQLWWRRTACQLAVTSARNDAALRVQVCWRRWQCRLRRQQEEILIERLEAAVCVQALWRGRRARKEIEMEQNRREEYMEQLEAAVCIQAVWKEHRVRNLSLLQSKQSDTVISAIENDSVGESDHAVERAGDAGATTGDERAVNAESLVKKNFVEQNEPTDKLVMNTDEMALTGDENLPPRSENSPEPSEDEDQEEGDTGGKEDDAEQESDANEDPARPEGETESKGNTNLIVTPKVTVDLLGPGTTEASVEKLQQAIVEEVAEALQHLVDKVCKLNPLVDGEMLMDEAHTQQVDSAGEENGSSVETVFAKGQAIGDECLPSIESGDTQKAGEDDEDPSSEVATTSSERDPSLVTESDIETTTGAALKVTSETKSVMQELNESAAGKRVLAVKPTAEERYVGEVLQYIADQVCNLNSLDDRDEVVECSEGSVPLAEDVVDFAGVDAWEETNRYDMSLVESSSGEQQQRDEPDEPCPREGQQVPVIDTSASNQTIPEANSIRQVMDTVLATTLKADHLDPKVSSNEKDGTGTLWISDAEPSDGSLESTPAAATAVSKGELESSAASALPRDESDPSSSTGLREMRDLGPQEAVGAEAREQPSNKPGIGIQSAANAVSFESLDQIPGFQEFKLEESKSLPTEDEVSRSTIAAPSEESSATEIVRFDEEGEQPKSDDDSGEESERDRSSSVDSSDLMWEVDAITSFEENDGSISGRGGGGGAPRKLHGNLRQNARLDSEKFLADLSRLEDSGDAHESR